MDKTQFGTFVAQRRREQGLTQKVLAERLHVTDKAVSKWERGLSYPDVTLLEPLAAALGIGVTELLSCRGKESGASEPAEDPEIQNLLVISGDSLRKERVRRWRWAAMLLLLLFAALMALGVLWGRSSVTESGILSVVHTEEQENGLLLFVEKGGHLLQLSCGPELDCTNLSRQITAGSSLQAEYRWNRRTWQGKLLRWQADRAVIGGPMDEVGASTDLSAEEGDALFGCPRVMMKIVSRRPNPWGTGYLSDYLFCRGDESEDWYLHADEVLVQVTDCLGYGHYEDGGFRTTDVDGDGARELLVRTVWPEKPCILYDWSDNGVEEVWLDKLPNELAEPPA